MSQSKICIVRPIWFTLTSRFFISSIKKNCGQPMRVNFDLSFANIEFVG